MRFHVILNKGAHEAQVFEIARSNTDERLHSLAPHQPRTHIPTSPFACNIMGRDSSRRRSPSILIVQQIGATIPYPEECYLYGRRQWQKGTMLEVLPSNPARLLVEVRLLAVRRSLTTELHTSVRPDRRVSKDLRSRISPPRQVLSQDRGPEGVRPTLAELPRIPVLTDE